MSRAATDPAMPMNPPRDAGAGVAAHAGAGAGAAAHPGTGADTAAYPGAGAPATAAGVLLFAHGARDPDWARPFEQVTHELRALRPGLQVRLAFLEFMAPSLEEAAAGLAAAGCTSVHVVPLFLGAGGHVRKDVPRLFARLRAAHPGTRFTLHPAAGERPEVIRAMAGAAASLVDPDPTP